MAEQSAELLPTVIESMCPNCEENGTTRLLLTRVPHFREIIIASFDCPHCHYRNQEVQFGGSYQEKGLRIELNVQNKKDTDRQIVKSDHATIIIPELQFEIPAVTQKGTINTLEGFLMKAAEDLQVQQPVRKILDPTMAQKIDAICAELDKCRNLERSFTVIVDDPSGNSNIENLCAPQPDPQLKVVQYIRTRDQNVALGLGLTADDVEKEAQQQMGDSLVAEKQEAAAALSQPVKHEKGNILSDEDASRFEKRMSITTADREILIFEEPCWNCRKPGECRMVETTVPYFKDIIIMAFTCDSCGFRSNEIKAGGAISAKGKRISLKVTNPDDMARDFLKSETASIEIPEIELVITEGSMGGKFTTIEGILQSLKSEFERLNAFDLGDSIEHGRAHNKQKVQQFLQALDMLSTGNVPFTIIVDDPIANSYIQNIYAPDEDPNMTIEEYDRTFEQNESLGLNDINVDNYEQKK